MSNGEQQRRPTKTNTNTSTLVWIRTLEKRYSNSFGYSWKLNEWMLIGRANTQNRNTKFEPRKTRNQKSQSAINYSLLRLFIYLSLLFFVIVFVFWGYRKKVLWVQRNENAVVFGQLSGKNWIKNKQRQKINDKKTTKNRQKKKNKKVSTLFNQMESFCQHVISFWADREGGWLQ